MRFALEVAEAVRAVVPRGIALGARITGSDWTEGGLTPDDAVTFAAALKEEGLDFVCVSSGGITAETRNPTTPGYNVPLAEKVRREAGIATRAVGLIASPRQAEAVVADGKADMVALARAVLDNPHWGWHAALELGAEVARPPQYARSAPEAVAGRDVSGGGDGVLSHAHRQAVQVHPVSRLDEMGGWLPDFLGAVRHCVASSLALEFLDDTGCDPDDHRIGARDHSRIQESTMLRAL